MTGGFDADSSRQTAESPEYLLMLTDNKKRRQMSKKDRDTAS